MSCMPEESDTTKGRERIASAHTARVEAPDQERCSKRERESEEHLLMKTWWPCEDDTAYFHSRIAKGIF